MIVLLALLALGPVAPAPAPKHDSRCPVTAGPEKIWPYCLMNEDGSPAPKTGARKGSKKNIAR